MPTRCQPGRRRNALHSKARDARGNGSTTASTAGACSHTGLRTKVSSCMRPPNQGIRKHRLHASAVATRFNLDRSEFQFFERASEGRRPHPPTPHSPLQLLQGEFREGLRCGSGCLEEIRAKKELRPSLGRVLWQAREMAALFGSWEAPLARSGWSGFRSERTSGLWERACSQTPAGGQAGEGRAVGIPRTRASGTWAFSHVHSWRKIAAAESF